MARGIGTEVLQGTLDLLVLTAIEGDPIHGWGISNRIRQLSKGVFHVGQGSLYPALHRYERRGWVMSYWATTPHNRIARFYTLTPAGRRSLEEASARWRRYTGAINAVIATA